MAFKYEQPILINFGAILTLIKNFQKVVFTDSARHTTLEHHRTIILLQFDVSMGQGMKKKF